MSTDPTGVQFGIGSVVPGTLQYGEDCVIEPRSYIGDGVVLGHRVKIGPNTTLLATSDGRATPSLLIRDDVVVGAAAVVSGASIIGIGARIEPGAVVTKDVPPHAIVAGNPAQVIGYVSSFGSGSRSQPAVQVTPPVETGALRLIGGASLIRFPEVIDLRGKLAFGEVGGLLPFEVQRFFLVYGVPTTSIRGEHAHRTLHELLICTAGSVRVSLTDGRNRCEVTLSDPSVGLYLPPFIWSTQFQYQGSSVLLVLCSETYNSASYIRDHDEYVEIVT